jgi:hypothetical protein
MSASNVCASRSPAIFLVPRDHLALDLLLRAGQLNAGILTRERFQPLTVLIAQRSGPTHCDEEPGGYDGTEMTRECMAGPIHDQYLHFREVEGSRSG